MSVKQNVIALLEENRSKVISGQELANQLHVSRAAIWKAIKTLKEEGYNIEATPNKGYVLLENSDVLSKQGIAYYLTEEIDIFSYKTIDSTNTQMKKLAINGGKNHSVIVSEEQSAGRGRFGRSFYSPAQKGVYMSVLLKTGDSLQNATMITIKTAVAVRRAIAKLYDIEVAIKWVNDLYYRGKKVCGILSEAISDFESGMIEAIIIGIGINVSTDNFPLEIASIATSLGLQEANRNQFIAEILNQLFAIIDEDFKLVLNEYRMASCVLHKQITFNQKGEQFTGLMRFYMKQVKMGGMLQVLWVHRSILRFSKDRIYPITSGSYL